MREQASRPPLVELVRTIAAAIGVRMPHADVIALIGALDGPVRRGGAIEVKPHSAAVQRAWVMANDERSVDHVDLRLAFPVPLSAFADLGKHGGVFAVNAAHPRTVQFLEALDGCTMWAYLDEHESGVTGILVRHH